jgi:hypothetical protein
MLFLVRHRLSGSKQQKLAKYMRRRKCPRLSLPLSIFYFFHKKPVMLVMPVPNYDFICYFLAQAFSLLDFQPVMPVPQWYFRLNRLQLFSSA